MSKHTPGPWTVVADGPWVCGKDGFTVALVQTSAPASETLKANARLIAAAPELLAAARAVVEIGDKASMSNLCHAIAKAEGEN